MDRTRRPLSERFSAKVNKTETCWLWIGATNRSGYGFIGLGGRGAGTGYAHRVSYELHVGPIPKGGVIDHKCRVRACVNPAHLQLVDTASNAHNLSGSHCDSEVGVRGVYFDKRRGRYCARAFAHGVNHWGGSFLNLADAEKAARELRNRVMTNNLADRMT